MTIGASDVKKIKHYIEFANVDVNPLASTLITPLFIGTKSLKMSRELVDEGNQVYFDSGGYYVQVGKIKYEDLYMPLLQIYRQQPWASIYTLPDQVPTSQDNPETVDFKVANTITYSSMFFHEMPDDLKPRAMPVVQGHNYRQIDQCLEAYINLGVQWIGFGSFGTSGANSEINIATQSSIELAHYVIKVAHEHGIKVHLFGLGTPALVAMIYGIGADSFDSSTWLKSAGFGQVFMPFMRAYNITYRNTISTYQRGIPLDEFEYLKRSTGHVCALCEDISSLQQIKMYRAVHNLIVMAETIQMINNGDFEHIQHIYKNGSIKYRGEFEKWLSS